MLLVRYARIGLWLRKQREWDREGEARRLNYPRRKPCDITDRQREKKVARLTKK